MQIRVFFVSHTLPASEADKLLKWQKSPLTPVSPKIRYKRHRCSVEADFSSTDAAIQWALGQKKLNKELSELYSREVYDSYTTAFGACEAREGDKCEGMSGSWEATEIDLFDAEALEACRK